MKCLKFLHTSWLEQHSYSLSILDTGRLIPKFSVEHQENLGLEIAICISVTVLSEYNSTKGEEMLYNQQKLQQHDLMLRSLGIRSRSKIKDQDPSHDLGS